jgi:uncharacterized protein YraI
MTFTLRTIHRIVIMATIAIASLIGAMNQPAQAQLPRPNGYPVTNVNLRAGPGTYYPVIVVVPTHAPIAIVGCLGDYTWCDVLFQGNRGWMRSIYLKKWYSGYYYSLQDYAPRLGLRVVSFDINPYWDSNYRERPFYRDKGRWGGSYGEGWTNRSVFYDRLAPYGDWIWLQGQYVWVPSRVGPHWRPYTVGRWVYTNRYGWMWSSREPFGWATYHYGRWGYSNRVGWFWVPGNRWAPAWVSWRKSNDYLAWAPLPPTSDEGLGLTIRVGTIPDYYWQVVPDRDFLDDDLPKRIVRDKKRFDPILRETQPLGNVTVVNNNVVVNNVVNVTYVEQKTEQKVVVHNVEKTKDEKQAGKVEGAAVEVFQPAADQAPSVVAPPAPKPIEEVAQESSTKQQNEGAPSTEELLVPAEIKALPAPAAESTAEDAAAQSPPPPAPPAEGAPPPAEEAAPPPPPPPAEAAQPSPPAAEEAAPPPPAAGESAPPPPAPPAGEAPPPPPPVEEAAPPPAPPADQAPPALPPPAEEAAPPSPTPSVEEMTPKAKQEKRKKDRGELPPPEEAPALPPPAEKAAPPPPPVNEGEPVAKPDGKRKKERGASPAEQAPPSAPPPSPPPVEQSAPPAPPPPAEQTPPPPPSSLPPAEQAAPPPPAADEQPKAEERKPKARKKPAPESPCPEGTAPLEDGSCVPIQ